MQTSKTYIFLVSVTCIVAVYVVFSSTSPHTQSGQPEIIKAEEWNTSVNSDLVTYTKNNNQRVINKWENYFEVYETHLAKFRNTDVTILEIGVLNGGSLQMWKNYFGPKAKIYGVDIDPRCKQVEEPQISVYIGDQEDRNFLAYLKREIPKIDIVIDDGGHTMGQQKTSFEELYPQLSNNGVYIVEDLHTSYLAEYGGGYRKKGTFIEMAKNLLDDLNMWIFVEHTSNLSDISRSLYSVHFYNSVAVFEKRHMSPVRIIESGNISLN